MSEASFEGLMFQDLRLTAMRETLRSVGVFLHPKFIEACSRDQKFVDHALLGLFRGVLVALTDHTQDLSMFTIEALNSISTDSIPDLVYSDYMSILDVLHGILSAISAPAFSPTLDQDELGFIAVERLTQLLPNSQFQVHLRYSNLRSTAKIPKADQGYDRPLWADEQPIVADPTEWKRTNEPRQISILHLLNALGSDWSFWRQWYQSFLDGTPLEWELQRQVALIDEAVWDAGPASVADAIREIEAKRASNTTDTDLQPEDVKTDKVTSLFDRAPIVQASMATLSETIGLRVDTFSRLTRPNEQIAFFDTLKSLPETAERIAQLVVQDRNSEDNQTGLALEVGRLRAQVEQLKADLKAAHSELEELRKKPWYKKSSVLVTGAVVSSLVAGVWTLSGDDKALEDRWKKLAVDLEFLTAKIWAEPEDRVLDELRFELPDIEDV